MSKRGRNIQLVYWGKLGLLLLLISACRPEPSVNPPGVDLTGIPYNPEPYTFNLPDHFPTPPIPAGNPQTVDGVELGRYLFYDPILSVDSTISCASCHRPELAFSDDRALSLGVNQATGRRNAMSLVNVAYYQDGLFWDGRVQTLEEQALHPIEDPVEMNDTWANAEERIRRHPDYQERFRRAFGIENSAEIDRTLITRALAQFERSLISATSRYDFAGFEQGVNQQFFTAAELRGRNLFFSEPDDPDDPHPGCTHCHTSVLLTTDEYANNGLDEAPDLTDFTDSGRGEVTNSLLDNGRFRIPTLRNIELTAPYMHDGRFQTLEEVLDHYSSGGHYAPNVDANIQPFPLSEEEISDLLAFFHTLTDTTFLNQETISNPFE